MWFPIYSIFHCNYFSILHRFQDIIAYFRKFKDVTWPWPRPLKGQFVIPMINRHLANQCTKFEVSSFSRSGDIVRGTKNLIGEVTITTPLLGWFFILLGWLDIAHLCTECVSSSFIHSSDTRMNGPPNLMWVTWRNHAPFRDGLLSVCCYNQHVYQIWNLHVDPLQRHQKWRKMQKLGWFGRLGITQGHRKHRHLIERIWHPIRL